MTYRTSAAFLFTLAIASAALAQSPAARPTDSNIMDTSMKVTGSVISVDDNRLVVKDEKGQEMVFIITDKQVNAAQFRPGDRVTASYTTLAGTGAVVTKVISAPAPVTTTTYVAPAAPAPEAKMTTRTVTEPAPVATTTAPVAARPYESEPSADLLPATASPLPLVALLGLLGAGGAAAIRRLRRS